MESSQEKGKHHRGPVSVAAATTAAPNASILIRKRSQRENHIALEVVQAPVPTVTTVATYIHLALDDLAKDLTVI